MRPYVVCMTPVRNEAWILDRFLRCASLWADRIIVLDQCSDDGSTEIARRFPKVELIEFHSPEFDEGPRRSLLIDAARRSPMPRLLVALDADEALSANFMDSPEWERVLSAAPGTVINLEWVNLLPGLRTYWRHLKKRMAFMDDGTPFVGVGIHGQRIPIPKTTPRLELTTLKILHYALVDPARVTSKVRWYQCFEALHIPKTSIVTNYRRYFHPHAVRADDVLPVSADWFDGYEARGIDVRHVASDADYWWDRDVLRLLAHHGPERLRHVPIWDADWPRLARDAGLVGLDERLGDPRGWKDRLAHRYLHATQRLTRGRLGRVVGWLDLRVDRLLRDTGAAQSEAERPNRPS